MFRCVLVLAWVLAFFGASIGCGAAKNLEHRATRAAHISSGKLLLQVAISPAANQNSPIAVDVVLVSDKSLFKAVSVLTASDWFAKKTSLQRQNPKVMDVKSWEWVPGQAIDPISFVVPVDAQSAMLFANYASPGPHSAALPVSGKVSIALNEQDFTVDGK